jgi:redox-sensitive bicupin YhaK (pirin superfamily)
MEHRAGGIEREYHRKRHYAASEAQLVVLSQQGKTLHIEATSDASVLLLSGEPLNEPIVGYGPFVMNTKKNREAVRDFNSGRFGQI